MIRSRLPATLLLCAAIACLASSCRDSPVTPPSLADVFPLAAGSSWSFVDDTGAVWADSVVENVSLRGLRYARFSSRVLGSSYYLRLAENRVLAYMEVGDGRYEETLFDFEAPVGTHWRFLSDRDCDCDFTIQVESRDEFISVPAATFPHCYRFSFDTSYSIKQVYVSPGVGIVGVTSDGREILSLVDYEIGSEPRRLK